MRWLRQHSATAAKRGTNKSGLKQLFRDTKWGASKCHNRGKAASLQILNKREAQL